MAFAGPDRAQQAPKRTFKRHLLLPARRGRQGGYPDSSYRRAGSPGSSGPRSLLAPDGALEVRSSSSGTLRRDPTGPASGDETRDKLVVGSSGAGGARRGRGGAAWLSAFSGSTDRLRCCGRRLRCAAFDPLAAAEGSAPGRVSRHACLSRRPDRGARLFPVRHQAQYRQGLHQRRLRAEADYGVGGGGPDRAMAAAIDGHRDDAGLPGNQHRPASGRRHLLHQFRFGRRCRSRPAADQHRQFGRAG